MTAIAPVPLLAARALAIAAGGHPLADALDFTVQPQSVWAVVGPNGAGKTTLLRTLAGLAPPAAGAIDYGGRPLGTLSPGDRARHRAFLPQDSQDAFPATALESVLIGRHPHLSRFAWESERDLQRARAALARFGLAGFADRDVRTLSGGERRRVALAALLVQDAPLCLLDEPSSHLDVAQQAAALDIFVAQAREHGRALVMVLHDLHLATRYATDAILLGRGRAQAGRAADLLTATHLSALFARGLVELRDGTARAFVPD